MEAFIIALTAALSFLAGATQNVGACARPAAEFVSEEQTITNEQNATGARRTTVALPVKAGLNPPECG